MDDYLSIGGKRLVPRDNVTPLTPPRHHVDELIEATFTIGPPNPKAELALAIALGLIANPESN